MVNMQAYDESCNGTPMARFQRSGSLTCPVQFLRHDRLRRSFSYCKVPQYPLKLTVLKLDGSSFEIEVPRNGKVAELKKAVEAAFSHLPCKVSWPHVWGNFCLSHDYEKLLSDSDPIGLYGIRDGDQLEFVRHVSVSYLGKRAEREEDADLDEPCLSNGFEDKQAKWLEHDNDYPRKLEYHRVDIYDDDVEEEEEKDSVNVSYESNRNHKLLQLLRKWFTHRKLMSSEKTLQRKGSVSRFFLDNSRNIRLLRQCSSGSRKIVEYDFDTRSCNITII